MNNEDAQGIVMALAELGEQPKLDTLGELGQLLKRLIVQARAVVYSAGKASAPRGKPCTCDNCLGSSSDCRVDAGERLGDLWYCRKRAESES